MKDSIYLVLNSSGVQRFRKNPPDLFMGEIAIKMNLVISDEWFNKVIPEGTVTIPNTAVLGNGLEIEFGAMEDTQLESMVDAVKVEIIKRRDLEQV